MTNRQRPRRLLLAFQVLLLTVLVVLGSGVAQAVGPGRDAALRSQGRSGSLPGALDALVRKQLADHRIPGAAVVVVQGGRQVFAQGYGVADIEAGTAVDPERTGFFLASDAKLFTAIAVLQQVEKGRLDLGADVNRYLKTFQVADTFPGRPVTVRDLLTHTAGFDNNIIGRATVRPEDVRPLGESLAEHQPRRVRPPGTVASYDNYGVALAGHLVETVTGTPFAQYVDRSILRPLGMRSTSFAQPHPPAVEARLAHGHRPSGGRQLVENGQYGDWSPTGAGAVSTAGDMGLLLRALLDDGGPLLTPKSRSALIKRQFGNDPRLPGLGYILEERVRSGQRMLVKEGDLPGFHGNLALLPERGAGVYVVYNGDGEGGGATWAGQEVADLVADHFGAARSAEQPVERSASYADVSPYEGDYRSTRTSSSELTRIGALTGSVRVEAGEGATLTTNGPLTRDPSTSVRHWVQISPGLFQEKGGQDRIAFGDGRLVVASDASAAYERLPWYQSPTLHQQALLASLAFLALTVLALPVLALVRRRSPGTPGGARAARLLLWTTGALITAATVCFVLLFADPDALNRTVMVGDSVLLEIVPTLITIALATTCAMVLCAGLAWRRRWWRLSGRVHYTCSTLAALVFLGVCSAYRLIG
ncbi:serine hydrolase domain-containing protein [Streptomyces griseus]|uniref:Serine hydrolase domain-containing protein n=1 Tax=Streptomyces stephensoniae TaxID=3375367 RepID=A0ABU2W9D1_9ACTN|nr:serine hydrolase domain-containing protein [Streptomyces griseus]MDT0493921.1 serine hydrolase domain-containing protein [Streptomyces griseus]